MTNRCTYKSYMVDMNSKSYRMKETKQRLKGDEIILNHQKVGLD